MIDETGMMLQPVVRRTWAPVGQTPVLIPYARHDRWSVIAAITLSPQRQRVGLYFEMLDRNVCGDDCERFLRTLHRRVGRPLLVVWDGLSAHKTAQRRVTDDHRFRFARFPPYSPQLNPVEYLWSNIKYGVLSNFCPDDVDELGSRAMEVLLDTRHEQHLLRSFFDAASLTLAY